ncbi:BRCA1-associated RING domain protein 1 isoform X1 [Chiloscyllium plagiosum]|uniref:BRCA1-associated RING domain protein 1 isoform X1 n=2 Tax=Chiloscyllium plagiosum TaxID=36176 RepID=UPI001CB80B65|nr:BRCA1-associated RING domain protein 1 isoform X1 [Chiloscyllium plagiosum]
MSGPHRGQSWAHTAGALAALEGLLQCSACCKLLQEPVCLGGCEHVFCRVCVADSLGTNCPVCHTPTWVKDLQPNRQLHNIADLCSQLRVLLNVRDSPGAKCKPTGSVIGPEDVTGKKWQMRTWFSPRSKKMRCVLDMNASRKNQKVASSSDFNGSSSSVFEFMSSPSPPLNSPKKKAPINSKQRVRKRLADANKGWGFGKRRSKKMERGNDSPENIDYHRVVSFCSQPVVLSSQGQTVADETAEESLAVPQDDNVIDSSAESLTKNLIESSSEACCTPTVSSCKDISLGQTFNQEGDTFSLVPIPATHTNAKRSRKSSDSRNLTLAKKSRKEVQNSCFEKSSAIVCEQAKLDTQQELSATPARQTELSRSINQTQAPSTENNCGTPSSRYNTQEKQCATPKSPQTPQATFRSQLPGSCAMTPISPLTPTMKRNHKGETPLHIASIKGDIAAVEQLLENGANPNIKDNAGWTPLHEACNHGHLEIVERLLKFGVLLNTPGYQNDSPLHDAVRNGHVEVVKLLILHRASQNVINIFGLRPVDYANSEEMIAALHHSPKNEDPVAEHCFAVTSNQRRDGPIVLLGSDLLGAKKKKLDKLVKLLKAGNCTEFNTSVTHIIVPNDQALSTMKCLMGIVSGCWLMNFEWVTACLEKNDRVAEEDYEINIVNGPERGRQNQEQQLPKLFDGCHFYFMGPFKSCKKEDLVNLVKVGGGQVLARQPKPDSDVTQSINTVAYHASPGSDQSFCTQYIISDKDSNYKPERVRLGKVWTTHSTWLIDCVKAFELLPITEH